MKEINEILFNQFFASNPRNCLVFIEALVEDALKTLAAREKKAKALPALRELVTTLSWYREGFLADPSEVKIPHVPSQYKKPHAIAAILTVAFGPNMEAMLKRFFVYRLQGTEILQARKLRVFAEVFKPKSVEVKRAGATVADIPLALMEEKRL